jgi:hypothetical protein
MADLSEFQWQCLGDFVDWDQQQRPRTDGLDGRWSEARRVQSSVLWVLRTIVAWKDLSSPLRGLSDPLVAAFSSDNAPRCCSLDLVLGSVGSGRLELSQSLVDVSFSEAKGGDRIGPTRCNKGNKIMSIADGDGIPVDVEVAGASPNKSTLVESTLERFHIAPRPNALSATKHVASTRSIGISMKNTASK